MSTNPFEGRNRPALRPVVPDAPAGRRGAPGPGTRADRPAAVDATWTVLRPARLTGAS
jgi:uncharacterized protein YbdZ (MbtH family)